MPEIRATVSNLSQAIRFVVQNDFFDGVELKPGDAQNQPIQVLDEPLPSQQVDSSLGPEKESVEG